MRCKQFTGLIGDDEMPKKYFNPYTDFGFEIAELSHLNAPQYEQYQKSLFNIGMLKMLPIRRLKMVRWQKKIIWQKY
jgi:hypothetical protein